MMEIGVRELKARLSDVLRRVEQGERVRVTVRNRPVADILPVGAPGPDERLSDLIARGQLVPPGRPRPGRAPRLARTKISASELILAERDAER
jgi:prevent-host-death family protein